MNGPKSGPSSIFLSGVHAKEIGTRSETPPDSPSFWSLSLPTLHTGQFDLMKYWSCSYNTTQGGQFDQVWTWVGQGFTGVPCIFH